MLIKLENGNNSIMFINEEKIEAVQFVKWDDAPHPYRLRIFAESMTQKEYFFENEELYNNALELFREYEKHKIKGLLTNA